MHAEVNDQKNKKKLKMPSVQDLILSEMRKINEHASLGAGGGTYEVECHAGRLRAAQ